ncbi:cytochrome c oxidase assembly factor 3 homolog, mitochondrial [Hyperolius riggenbachi]|uniref:cytochrome c oxidase assembly factor 3 homolog, mitochondrial n=1 Tax=Hyperolius riggenbachi TaxID=752182 RepID=UPI0035A39625
MAEMGSSQGSELKDGERIDPKKLTTQQQESVRRAEIAHWRKNSGKMKSRNIFTALAIGTVVLGIYGYTFFSVKQERFIDELEEEAKVARARYPKTSAN